MHRFVRVLGCCALVSSLAACVVSPSRQIAESHPAANPHEMAAHRLEQVDGRIDNMGNHIDARVNQGHYPPPEGAALHRRLDTIRQESRDMAAQHGGGLTGDEQRVLNQELDTAAAAINR
jgi:hypothetical protein